MKSLFARLSLALLVVVVMIGGCFLALAQFSTRLYYEEITQRLNASIAMYIAGEDQLIAGGTPNRDALATLAQQAMVINPTLEIYLLDASGRILGHALPPDSVIADTVDLGPVHEVLDGSGRMPVRGTDPRHSGTRKIFSVFPVTEDDGLQGYVYAILGGQKYDALAANAWGSYVLRLTAGALLAVVLAGFLTGTLVFGLLTRRLRRLTRDVRDVTAAGFDSGASVALPPGDGNEADDEIGALRTAFTRMAHKIREQFEVLKESDRLRRELITNVSHDLRTPLSSMHGYVETLLIRNDQLSADDRRRYLEITHKHSQRLTALINELFELAKLESAGVEPSLEYFCLAELLQDVGQEFELDADKKNVRLQFESLSAPATVYADIALVQRVLENLMRNALKFTPAGGQVVISLDCHPDRVAVAIADTGCGIARQDLDRVFERGYGTGQESASTGLGLAIVRRILDLHGCRIAVSSEVGKGTRFEFALPTGRAA